MPPAEGQYEKARRDSLVAHEVWEEGGVEVAVEDAPEWDEGDMGGQSEHKYGQGRRDSMAGKKYALPPPAMGRRNSIHRGNS